MARKRHTPEKSEGEAAPKDALTRQQLAAMFGVNAQQFDRKYRPHIPDRHIVAAGTGRRALFHPQAVRAICDSLVAEERGRLQMANDDALLLGGDEENSPALERLRLAKAQIAELELAEKRGHLIRPHLATTALAVVAAKIRRLGASLAKKHGRKVADQVERVLDDCEREMEKTFDEHDAGHRDPINAS